MSAFADQQRERLLAALRSGRAMMRTKAVGVCCELRRTRCDMIRRAVLRARLRQLREGHTEAVRLTRVIPHIVEELYR